MAMLAEPRRRKNYVLTPRGKPLYDDDSRFGSKMLQKMGWTKGKGLGAKESGDTDFVRVNFKSDSGGLGFENRDDQWTQHEHGFNGLLETLNAHNGDTATGVQEESDDNGEDSFQTPGFGFKTKKKENKAKVALSGESLEEKSKKSKARVHYKKFTKGKDLSQYTEKDLANIFGKKALDTVEEKSTLTEQDNEEDANAKILEDKSTSIADYFKQKMEKRKRKSSVSRDLVPAVAIGQNNDIHLKESTSSISDYFKRKMEDRKLRLKDPKPEFSVDAIKDVVMIEKTAENINQDVETHDEEPARKKRKKDKKSSKKEINAEALPETYFAVGTEKRKKKKKTEVEILPENLKNCNSRSRGDLKTDINNGQLPNPNEDGVTTASLKKSKNKNTSTFQSKIIEIADNSNPSSVSPSTTVSVSIKLEENTKSPDSEKLLESSNPNDNLANFNEYIISTFVAEKFRQSDPNRFDGSNLMHLNGYAFDKDVKLSILKSVNDEKRIVYLWEQTLSKYEESRKKSDPAQSAKRKHFNRFKQKRKSVFKVGM